MIPQFPEFKKLELSDKAEVYSLTSAFTPTSDFNFAGTWSWDVRNKMQISRIDSQYVIRFIDYVTGEPFYTFIGNTNCTRISKLLLDHCKEENIEATLRLISEETTQNIDASQFNIQEDRDNFDYIYDLEQLAAFTGQKYKNKRNQVNNFLSSHPNVEIRIIQIESPEIQRDILELFNRWTNIKNEKDLDFELHDELIVINNFFQGGSNFDLVTIGIYIEGILVAFCLNELINSDYVMAHVAKADTSIPGISAYLMQKNAEMLISKGKKYLNYEQDLGMENLRNSKMQFNPVFFIKKYRVKYL